VPDRLLLKLTATPTLKIPNIGLGDLSDRSDRAREMLHALASMAKRRDNARTGLAMRDGSFPIANVPQLRNAVAAYTFAENKDKAKRFIIRRANALGRQDLLPESWGMRRTQPIIAADANGESPGIMVAIYPPGDVAQYLAGTEEGDALPGELHVTLAYLGEVDDYELPQIEAMHRAVRDVATTQIEPLTARVQGFGSFMAPDGMNPHWYSVDATDLAMLRTALVLSLEFEDVPPRVDHDFTPHMTVRYGGNPIAVVPPGGETEWKVDTLYLVVGGERAAYRIGGAGEYVDAESPGEFADQNNLETYWKVGEGARKVRWGTPGDFTRCDKHLRDKVGPERSARICAQWHYDMNGFWPGDKKNMSVLDLEEGRPVTEGINASAAAEWSGDYAFFWDPNTDAAYRVKDNIAETFGEGAWIPTDVDLAIIQGLPSVDDPDTLETIVGSTLIGQQPPMVEGAGAQFRIPIIIPEGIPSGDRRLFTKGSLEFKDPPMPLLWQKVTAEGHDNSVTVGKITHVERLQIGGVGNALGVFDTHDDAVEAARQVREKFLTGVSGDVDQFEAELAIGENGEESMTISHGRLVGATLVSKPAFQEAAIEFITTDEEPPVILASAGPVHPPSEWFTNPSLTEPTQLSVDENGRVFGHIAAWGQPHLGNPSIKPPHTTTGYKYFNRRPVRTEEGRDVMTGQLTLTGGHADLGLDVGKTMAHYDDTRSAVADVVAGEDEFGIWVAGAMRPDISEFQVRAFRGSEPSGDWRLTDEGLELVAVCQVNTPGFPVLRPRTLVASGKALALVAAGTMELRKGAVPGLLEIVASLAERLEVLEKERRDAKAADIRERLATLRS
jgi:2'-5' RNA ligase